MTWQVWKGGWEGSSKELARCGRCKVGRWQGGKGGRMEKWQGERFLVLFKIGGYRVSPRFHLFVSDVD